MESWWDLGEGYGHRGHDLQTFRITCPFCKEKGNFSVAHHAEKKKPNDSKKLNFDTLKCGSCSSFVMVLWSAGSGLYNFHTLPWPLKLEAYPEYWPATVGRFWLQAKRNLADSNWDAAVVMARSSLQAALRDKKATGSNLKQEIDDLARKGHLPPIIQEWSHEVRQLGNEAAHPDAEQPTPTALDAKDIVRFLDFLLECLYGIPHRIELYRARKDG